MGTIERIGSRKSEAEKYSELVVILYEKVPVWMEREIFKRRGVWHKRIPGRVAKRAGKWGTTTFERLRRPVWYPRPGFIFSLAFERVIELQRGTWLKTVTLRKAT